jgi:23S rRNA (guanosine2251-2'-O)-methyltransferase
MSKSQAPKIVVILNNIRSSENVGSIFRTSDAVGVSKIILCGYTPAPLDRFGRENKKISKAALGAEKFIEWEKMKSLSATIKNLKKFSVHSQMLRKSPPAMTASRAGRSKNNFSASKIVGIEQSENSVDYREIKKFLNHKSKFTNLVLVFGNEVDGLSKSDLKLCDIVAELPMLGRKESLNVSVCAGIVLYSLI